MIEWTSTKEDMELSAQIAKRAVIMAKEFGLEYDQMTAVMDIAACHGNGCPLRLAELLATDRTNFAHDVFGIRENIDRTTGELLNCFLPRYSA